MTDSATGVIWTRNRAPAKRGWQKWALLAVALLCGVGAFAAWMADDAESAGTIGGLGVLLVAFIALGPKVLDRARHVDPEITFDGTTLRCGKQRPVEVARVASWRVATETQSVHSGQGATSRVPLLRAEFTLSDGGTSELSWAYPQGDDRKRLERSLTSVLGRPSPR